MPPPPENHPKPKPPKPKPAAVRDLTNGVALPLPPDPFACAYHRLCAPPPPSHTATLHLRSARLPTPLIALSASVLAVSVLLLLVLFVCHVVRWRRGVRQSATLQQQQQHGTPLNHHAVDEEGGSVALVRATAEENTDSDDRVHHVWYIRTVGLDERAIAAITALVYDADKCRAAGLGADGGCAVCLAEFRDGETLRLLPRCAHAFHRACIDTWLRAHVNCPLCRAPIKLPYCNAAALASETEENPAVPARTSAEEARHDGDLSAERAVRRAASMAVLPRRPWPDVDSLRASNSARQGEMGLAKISQLLKLSEALEMAGIGLGGGRSASFNAASSLRLPGRSGQPATNDITR